MWIAQSTFKKTRKESLKIMELFEKAEKGKRDREEITDNSVFLKLKKKGIS